MHRAGRKQPSLMRVTYFLAEAAAAGAAAFLSALAAAFEAAGAGAAAAALSSFLASAAKAPVVAKAAMLRAVRNLFMKIVQSVGL